ncbi:MAG: ABC transporter permease [Bacteroidales bacterium]|jgi:putative ABC transport system permease protein|nr:ABC transporter permease [Bacteroidales bacterium]
MFDIDRWQEIWITITRNKMRSILTAFGVFWGIFMLIVMSGSGNGLENGIMSGVKSFAGNTAFFWPEQTSMPYKGFQKGRNWNIKIEDVKVLKTSIPEIKYISPVRFGGRRDNNVIRGERSGAFNIKGIMPEYNQIDQPRILQGRNINEIDMNEKRKVCTIGKRVYEELFDAEVSPIGELVQVNGIYYTVIGVIQSASDIQMGGRTDDSVILPYSTMEQAYNMGDDIHFFLAVTASDKVKIGTIEEMIKNILKKRHDIAPNDHKAIGGMNIEKQFSIFNNLFLGIRALIWIVGLGTLLAGAIGVSNIMMVTVRERTKEIGIRRALGAKPIAIVSQIMSESLILTIIAGFFGLVCGVGFLSFLEMLLSNSDEAFFSNAQISFGLSIIALAILSIFGLLAGLIPAGRALKIKAIDAIREE